MKVFWSYDIFILVCFIVIVFTTIVTCFWCVYLFEGILRKWKIYKHALRCLQEGECDFYQQTLTYNCKTEFVKSVFLFFMNLVEWTGFMLALLLNIPHYLNYIQNVSHENKSMNIFEHSINLKFSTNKSETLLAELFLEQYFPFFENISFALSFILIASLCMYLASRYAQKSWIKSDKMRHLIGVFLVSEIVIQIAASFCYTRIIAMWCDKLILTASLIIAIQQYRKLIMVINWLIVDLKVCNNSTLLIRQVRMKRNFTRIMRLLSIGSVFLLASEYFEIIILTLIIILRDNDQSHFYKYLSLCEFSNISNDGRYILLILYWTKMILIIIGSAFILLPYIGCGLLTMCTILWRLCKGKTGYRTHYRNPLFAPLIRDDR